MDEIIKIAVIGVIGAILSVTLKNYKKEFSMLIGIGTGIAIVWVLFDNILKIKNLLGEMVAEAGINGEYVGIMVKVIIIAYISEFAVQLCNDAGEKAIGAKVELAGRLIILGVSLPIMESLFNLILNISF